MMTTLSPQAVSDPSDALLQIADGFAAGLGQAPAGWFLAALIRPDIDEAFRASQPAMWNAEPDTLQAGQTLEGWLAAKAGATSRLVLLREGQATDQAETLAEGSGIDGPAVAVEAPGPLVAWTERAASGWRLRVYDGQGTHTAGEHEKPLGKPAVAATDTGWVAAAQSYGSGGPGVVLCHSGDGEPDHFQPGRNPSVAARGNRWWLAYEALTEGGTRLTTVAGEGMTLNTPRMVPAADDLNLQPRLGVDGERVMLVHEACPMWGFDEQFGRHRQLYLWQYDAASEAWVPAEHTANGLLPTPFWATREIEDKNFPAIQPELRLVSGMPLVFFRRFRHHGGKAYGWDVLMLRGTERGWQDPQVISPNYGHPEAPAGILPDAEGGVLAMACCTQLPVTRYEPALEGPTGCATGCERPQSNHPGRPYDNRVELVRWHHRAEGEAPPRLAVVPGTAGRYAISPAVPDIAPEPPAIEVPGKTLLWADLHVHSTYSKCAAPNDGTPEENLRFQRDRLGCRVLCLTEHTHLMSHAECEHSFDVLEREAGDDAVALYASEPLSTGQDTIFYAVDRDVIRRFSALPQITRDRATYHRLIKQHLPPRSLIVARHFHSGDERGSGDPASDLAGFDPELEPFMEAQQTRGDNLRMEGKLGPGTVRHFLAAGCKLGLVGGSDHALGRGPDHVGLTGLWVDEVSPAGVWAAMWDRRTFSVSNAKIAMWATLNGSGLTGAMLGDAGQASGPLRFQVQASCPFPLTRVYLQRDGLIVQEQSVDGQRAEVELVDETPMAGPHWYVVSAEARSRFMYQPAVCHLSPFFVDVL